MGKGSSEADWAKIQPFPKRLGQNTTFWEKVQAKQTGPKNNLLGKGWAKIQPFRKRLDQKFMCEIQYIRRCNYVRIQTFLQHFFLKSVVVFKIKLINFYIYIYIPH